MYKSSIQYLSEKIKFLKMIRVLDKVTGMVFRCNQDVNNLKNNSNHVGGKNHQFEHFILDLCF